MICCFQKSFTQEQQQKTIQDYEDEIKRYEQAITEKYEELRQLRQKLAELEKGKTTARKLEKKIENELKETEEKIKNCKAEIDKLCKLEAEVREKINLAMSTLTKYICEICNLKESLQKDVVFILYWKRAYGSFGLKDLTYYLYLLRSKNNLYNLAVSAKEKIEKRKETLERAYHSVVEKRKVTQKEYVSIIENKKTKEEELNKTVKLREYYEREVEKLRAAAKTLQSIIDNLEKKKKDTLEEMQKQYLAKQYIESMKTKFEWPVEGKIVSYYGKQKHDVLDTYIFNAGIKIQPFPESVDKSVKAISDGTVGYVGNIYPYGNTVIISHGGGYYSVYSGLKSVKVSLNAQVAKGDIIGELGEEPLYFEFRVNGKPVNPLEWLVGK
jgi:septal ring factor EnvC (AmiA/AmiB activator)